MKILATIGQPSAIRYAASYKSNTNLGAAGTETVFSAASNTLGAWVWRMAFIHTNSAGVGPSFLAKATAPTTSIDGDLLCQGDTFSVSGATNFYLGKCEQPIFVPAGKGLFYFSPAAETSALRSALYTLLT